jgi:glycosyltransferase involved in cell wall biosynthesis
MTKVTVIVSTYSRKRSNSVLECIESLRKQTLKPAGIVLVVESRDLAAFYLSNLDDIEIALTHKRGLSNARNVGVTKASGDIVAFIDDDAVADRKWLETLVKNYNDSEVVSVGGLVEPVWECGRPSWFPEELDWVVGCSYKGLPERRSYVRNPLGCNMSFRRYVFEQAGFFEDYLGRFGNKLLDAEETEFSLRVLRKLPTSKIIYDPSAIVYHKVSRDRETIRYLAKRSFYQGLSKGLLQRSEIGSSQALSLERRYLKHLLREGVIVRLKQAHKKGRLSQLATLFLSIPLVGAGYLASILVSHAFEDEPEKEAFAPKRTD